MRRQKTARLHADDPHGLAAWMLRYLEWMQVQHYAATTVNARRVDLHQFNEWCKLREVTTPQAITRALLERYQRHLFYHRQDNGKPLSYGRQQVRLIALKGFFKWLAKYHHILYNPAGELELPRQAQRHLPQAILSPQEVDTLLQQPDLQTPLGLRDRAILETFYSTGMRRAELAHLTLYDIDRTHGTLFIRQGKGRKDRVVPIGERALAWIEKYLAEVRGELCGKPQESCVFLTYQGEGFVPDGLSFLVRKYIELAAIPKRGSCHLFRHSMATAMLENGADVRFIQEMLGHTHLETTQRYTHVSIGKLKEIHTATHPTAKGPSRAITREIRGDED